ncbi:MAG TPA: WecB/TagA/CpsF family glycosyltransferase, partial [Ktedonobacterales bacterium]
CARPMAGVWIVSSQRWASESPVAVVERSRATPAPLAVDALTLADAARRVCTLAEAGERAQVVTLNPELVIRARRDAGLAEVIRAARLVTADGAGVVWALRLAGQSVPARVTGVDLAVALAREVAARGLPIYLLGAPDGVALAASDALARIAPGLRIAGCWAGSPRPGADAEAVARIAASGARLALVAYGAPAQEFWIARNLAAAPPLVAIGVGGAFDMLAGRIPRAPDWMRAVGLEWLHRLLREPRRWRRMLALPHFALLAVAAALRIRVTRSPAAGILIRRDSPQDDIITHHPEIEDA